MKKEVNKNLLYELIWFLVIGCLLGYLLESFWFYVRHGVWFSKVGMLYGPFQPIYGIGAVLLTICLKPFKHHKWYLILLYGFLIGTVFEFVGSIFQETLFGTYTWTYAAFKNSISHRIYLPYCIGWGVISLLWIKCIYPYLSKFINRFLNPVTKVVTLFIGFFMLFSLFMTSVMMIRYSDRYHGKPANNALYRYVDHHYDDDYVARVFPKLKIVKD